MMTENKTVTILARAVSVALHPLAMPLYGVALMLFGPTVWNNLPPNAKYYCLGVIALTTMAVPALCVVLMNTLGFVRSLGLEERNERSLPIAVVMVCYVACVYMISDPILVFLVRKLLLAAIGCLILALTVNFFWKISLHMIAAGGMLAILALTEYAGFGRMITPICVWIVLSGLLASARLWLGAHNPAQVYAGFAAGFLVAGAVMSFF